MRTRLKKRVPCSNAIGQIQESVDGSKKLIFLTDEGFSYSAVLMPGLGGTPVHFQPGGMPDELRLLHDGHARFKHLSRRKSWDRFMPRRHCLCLPSRVSNVVFIRMGEPLDNYDNVLRAVRLATHREGLKVAPGERPFRHWADRPGCRVRERHGRQHRHFALRDNGRGGTGRATGRRFGIDEIVSGLAGIRLAHGHVFTIEYSLIKGVGDSPADARRLSAMAARFPSKINLIPFNPWPGCHFERPDDATIEAFREILERKHHTVTVRISRGQDIGAACGQLDGCKSTG